MVAWLHGQGECCFLVHAVLLTAAASPLAQTANHVAAFGRLIIRGKDYGIHAFLVQIRSYKDHTPLLGIEVGDIGTKFGPLTTLVS